MEYVLYDQNKTCCDADVNKIIQIYDKYSGIPRSACRSDVHGNKSCGFYIGLLELEQHKTDPKLFFELLEIDQKIGWTDPNIVEELVFFFKGIKIIEDENVSWK